MTDTLKPCPFCGGSNLEFQHTDIEGWIAHVVCQDCDDMIGPMSQYKYDDKDEAATDAAEVWNRRPALSRPIDPKAEVEPVAWMPIATAPKTGEEFIARTGPEWGAFSCSWDGDAFVHYDKDDGSIYYSPTEWLPMPEAGSASPSIVAPVGVTEEMVNAAYRVINESWWSESWDADVPKGLSRRALEAALAAAPALTPAEKAGVGDELIERINEVFGWRKTGVLTGEALRARATEIRDRYGNVFDMADALSMAEKETAEEAMRLVLSRALSTTKPAQGDGELAKMRKALEPFAKWSDHLAADHPDDLVVIAGPSHIWEVKITAGQFRAARAALAAQGDDAQEERNDG